MKVGDRVIGKPNTYSNIVGKVGTVIHVGSIISVEFDEYINGHDCPHEPVQGKDGYCWNCEKYDIELTNQEPTYEIY